VVWCRAALQDLFYRYGGLALDSKEYRKAAATRVGVTIPDRIPLREFDHTAKYLKKK
jgi:hypothetical protein